MSRATVVSCPKCSSPVAIRIWREPEDDHELVLWECAMCANEFETREKRTTSPAELKEAVDTFWPTMLVA